MTDSELQALLRLAKWHGVQLSYRDMNQRQQKASPDSLFAILRVLGLPIQRAREAPDVMRSEQQRLWARGLEPVCVAWEGRLTHLEVALPAEARHLAWQVDLETGERKTGAAPTGRLPASRKATIEGQRYAARSFALPFRLPFGYHRLAIEVGERRFKSHVLSAPIKAYSPKKEGSLWGVFLPLYALRGKESWGSGDFSTLQQVAEWLASLTGKVVGTLPLLPAFLGQPFEPSPYSPVSRLFWNEFYIDITRAPELAECSPARAMLDELRGKITKLQHHSEVRYREEMALKRRLLEPMAAFFFSKERDRSGRFREFLKLSPQVEDYARFRATLERRGQVWSRWPERLRDGRLRAGDYSEQARQYHLYAQYLAHQQVKELSERSAKRGVEVYLDMPLGVHSDGYDVWRERHLFALDACGGAPPDPVFTRGQNWGFAPLHPERLRESGYHYVIAYLRHHLRHARMLRFDHVMSLHRLFWIPKELPASQGAYVGYRSEEFYAILSLESHRHGATIFGENLGTVPPEVNRGMDRHGVRRMYVVQYEMKLDPKRALLLPPRGSVAALNTHDMSPFAGFWQGLDITDRADLGLLRKSEVRSESERRESMKRALIKFLRRVRMLSGEREDKESVLLALLGFLGSSQAGLVLVNLEDLWGETQPQNVPGTSAERSNWRRKARLSLEEICRNPDVLGCLQLLQQSRNQKRKGRHSHDRHHN